MGARDPECRCSPAALWHRQYSGMWGKAWTRNNSAPLNLSQHLPSTCSRSNSKKLLLCEKARSPGRDARFGIAFDSGRAGNAVTSDPWLPPHPILAFAGSLVPLKFSKTPAMRAVWSASLKLSEKQREPGNPEQPLACRIDQQFNRGSVSSLSWLLPSNGRVSEISPNRAPIARKRDLFLNLVPKKADLVVVFSK